MTSCLPLVTCHFSLPFRIGAPIVWNRHSVAALTALPTTATSSLPRVSTRARVRDARRRKSHWNSRRACEPALRQPASSVPSLQASRYPERQIKRSFVRPNDASFGMTNSAMVEAELLGVVLCMPGPAFLRPLRRLCRPLPEGLPELHSLIP